MIAFDVALATYLDQPVRYGHDDYATRAAEQDAFTAGWEAAHRPLTQPDTDVAPRCRADIDPIHGVQPGRGCGNATRHATGRCWRHRAM